MSVGTVGVTGAGGVVVLLTEGDGDDEGLGLGAGEGLGVLGDGEGLGLGEGEGLGLGDTGTRGLVGFGDGEAGGADTAGLTLVDQSRPRTFPGDLYWQTYVGHEQSLLTAQPSLVVSVHTRAVK
jgi:hypothetical protein